jgi:hypothetical protein
MTAETRKPARKAGTPKKKARKIPRTLAESQRRLDLPAGSGVKRTLAIWREADPRKERGREVNRERAAIICWTIGYAVLAMGWYLSLGPDDDHRGPRAPAPEPPPDDGLPAPRFEPEVERAVRGKELTP